MKFELFPQPKSPKNYDAILFDFDGTLFDSMSLHVRAWEEEIASRGYVLPKGFIEEHAGMPGPITVQVLNQVLGSDLEPIEVAHAKEERFRRDYLSQIQPLGVVWEYFQEAVRLNIPVGIVSGGVRRVIEGILRQHHMLDAVSTIVGAEDVQFGKPHPEPFLLGAERLGANPKRCLAFEDAEKGRESAQGAGMEVIMVRTSMET